jgi:hypothetical protein
MMKTQMQTFTFQQIQYGYWGQTAKRDSKGNLKQIKIKAKDILEAELLLRQRKDHHKRLRNGDSLGWFEVTA